MTALRWLWSGRPHPVPVMAGTLVLFGVALFTGASLLFTLVVYVVGFLVLLAANASAREQDRRDLEMEEAGEADGR